MSYDKTYNTYSGLSSNVRVEVKRINSNGTYELDWIDIAKLLPNGYIANNSIQSIKTSLPQDSFSYGVLNIPSCTLKFISINGEFANELGVNSIFNGWVRHESLIRIFHGYKDPKTDTYDYIETYRGFIDEKSKNTKVSNDNTYQNLYIEDIFTYLLKKYTFSDITTTSIILSDLLVELFDRPEFTDFLVVDVNNLNPGYDIQNIDYTEVEGQTQWITILQGLSTGHSYSYQKEGTLIYQSINLPNSNQNSDVGLQVLELQDGTPLLFQDGSTFNLQGTKSISFDSSKIMQFISDDDGVNDVYEKLFWKDTAISFTSIQNLYNRSKTFDIGTITNNIDRENLLAEIGTRTSRAKKKFKLKIVLFTNINVLDRVIITAGDYISQDDFIWDLGNWDEEEWSSTTGATFSGTNSTQVVKQITHNFSAGTTDLLIEEI